MLYVQERGGTERHVDVCVRKKDAVETAMTCKRERKRNKDARQNETPSDSPSDSAEKELLELSSSVEERIRTDPEKDRTLPPRPILVTLESLVYMHQTPTRALFFLGLSRRFLFRPVSFLFGSQKEENPAKTEIS